jgi:hypothetical protein
MRGEEGGGVSNRQHLISDHLLVLASWIVEALAIVRMALFAPRCRMANICLCPCSAFYPADPKNVQNVKVSTNYWHYTRRLHTQLNIFGFNYLDLLIKLMKIMLL